MSKYEPLWKYIKENKKDEYKLSFEEVKEIVGFEFDHAFLTYKKELLDYGYEFKRLSLKEKWVWIVKNKRRINMKVLLVNGGPHKNGCTNRALEEVEKELKKEGIDTEIFWIGNKPISGCIACKNCYKNGKCSINDVVNEFAAKCSDADGFIFGTPVHYAASSGAISSFMDRLFYSTSADLFRFKPAACVVSARRAGTTATYDQINKYFGINQMPIISSRYWNMVHGGTKEEVEQDKEGLQIMRILGKNMAYFLKCIESAKKMGITEPEQEEINFTNFIR